MIQEIAAYLSSLTIGLSLGLIGAGGSILTVPVFVYVLQKDPIASSVYSMFVVGACSLVGTIRSIIGKVVDFQAALLFGIPSICGVLVARKLVIPAIPAELIRIGNFALSKELVFLVMLSLLMTFAGLKMLRSTAPADSCSAGVSSPRPVMLACQGLIAGLVTGLLGIGGGFLIVPALHLWAKLPMKTAIGTTLLIITCNSLFGFLTSYAVMPIDWILLLRFSAGAIIGILAGTMLARRIPSAYLKKMFGCFILFIAFYILYRQLFSGVRQNIEKGDVHFVVPLQPSNN